MGRGARRGRALRLVAALLFAAVSLGAAPPTRDYLVAQQDAQRVLAGRATKGSLSRFFGTPPSRCVASGADAELCQWELRKSNQGWRTLAGMLDTGARLNVLCDLPTDGSTRGSDACSVHPQLSNRDEWNVSPRYVPKRSRRQRGPGPSETRDSHRRLANAWLDEADTLVELSRLVGAAPDECEVPPDATEIQVCFWRTSKHTQGHGTLATSIGASPRKKVRMSCELPRDGGARQPYSCFAEVGR